MESGICLDMTVVILVICAALQLRLSDFTVAAMEPCQPVPVPFCASIGFNATRLPNAVGHKRMKHARADMRSFFPVIEMGCSMDFEVLMCSVLFPMCVEGHMETLLACRDVCEAVRDECLPVLHEYNMTWPALLDCTRLPEVNVTHTMCIDMGALRGSGGMGTGGTNVESRASSVSVIVSLCIGLLIVVPQVIVDGD